MQSYIRAPSWVTFGDAGCTNFKVLSCCHGALVSPAEDV